MSCVFFWKVFVFFSCSTFRWLAGWVSWMAHANHLQESDLPRPLWEAEVRYPEVRLCVRAHGQMQPLLRCLQARKPVKPGSPETVVKDHPMTDVKWLITHGYCSKSPKDRVMGQIPNGRYSWLINGDDPNHLLTGMILQVVKDAQQSHVIHVKSWGGVFRFHGRRWKRKNHVYYDWVWQLSVFLYNPMSFLNGDGKKTRKPQGMHSGKHRNGKWIRIEDVFPSENRDIPAKLC